MQGQQRVGSSQEQEQEKPTWEMSKIHGQEERQLNHLSHHRCHLQTGWHN